MCFYFFLVALELTFDFVKNGINRGIHVVGSLRSFGADSLGSNDDLNNVSDLFFNSKVHLNSDRLIDIFLEPVEFFLGI